MAKVHIWPQNLKVTLTRLDTFQFGLPVAASKVTKALAEQILDDSDTIPPVVPVDTEDLRSTGRVERAKGGWAVVYGGTGKSGKNVNYANQVHDDLRPRKYKRKGSGPKFVETHYLRRTEAAGPTFKKVLKELADYIFR